MSFTAITLLADIRVQTAALPAKRRAVEKSVGRAMRIGLVLESFDWRRGGLEQWTCQFASQLVRRGHEVHVVARRFAASTRDLPVTAHPVEGPPSRLGFAAAVEAKLRTLSLDVVHDMGVGWCCNVFQPHGGSWTSVMQRKLLLCPPWLRPLKRRIDPLLPRQAAFRSLIARQYAPGDKIVIALSRMVADDLERHHQVPPERIRIVHNGVDTRRFSPDSRAEHRQAVRGQLGIEDEALLALIVAHNFRLKGVPTLLRAMRRLAAERASVRLVVVGGKPKHLGRWRRMAWRLDVARSVTFVGSADDTVPYYAAADVYVHPTLYDPCSLVILEAAASGLPVITTSCCNGVAELLSEDAAALFVSDPTGAAELADRMRLMLDESLRREMGGAARRMALKHTLDRNVEEILAIYRGLAPARRAAA
jgi:UDP-glucose:(heptosyl)LPS alpha-1,3-glucosyltransferase